MNILKFSTNAAQIFKGQTKLKRFFQANVSSKKRRNEFDFTTMVPSPATHLATVTSESTMEGTWMVRSSEILAQVTMGRLMGLSTQVLTGAG